MTKKELLAQAKVLPVLLQVGKNGVSDAFLAELSLLVKKKGLVKVRFLKNFADAHDVKSVVAQAAEKASLLVVARTGNTVVFARPGKQ